MIEIAGTTYLTVRETARYLGIATGTLRNRRTNGTDLIPSMSLPGLGHVVFYRKSDVEAYVKAGGH